MSSSNSLCARSTTITLAFVILAWILPTGDIALLAEEKSHPEHALKTDDTSLGMLERKIRAVLTPEQEERFVEGVEPSLIELENGETLEEFITRTESAQAAGLVYKPVAPCVLVDTRKTGERFNSDEVRTLFLRGNATDYSAYGGSETGCGIPGFRGQIFKRNTARALFVTIESHTAAGDGQIRIWPAHDHLIPTVGIVEYGQLETSTVSVIVSLCDDESLEPCSTGDLLIRAQGAAVDVVLRVVGYLESVAEIQNLTTAGEPTIEKSLTSPFWETGLNPGDIHYSDGNVGIGVATPTSRLHVSSPEVGAIINQTQSINGTSLYFEPDYPTLFVKRGSDSRGASIALGNSSARFYLYGSGSSFGIYTPSEEKAMTLDLSGNLGIGTAEPARRLHVRGGFALTDHLTEEQIVRTMRRTSSGYAGGSPHDNNIWIFNTPSELADGASARRGLSLASPEVHGGETSYLYAFGGKNIRLGNVNDGWRRSEIELYNNNTGYGRILFRTGKWRDPANTPGVATNVRMAIENNGQVWLRSAGVDTQLLMTDYVGDDRVEMGYSNDLKRFAIHQTAGNETNSLFVSHAAEITAPVFQFQTNTTPNALTITEQGYVGVGTRNPDQKMTISGVTHIRSNNPILRLTDTSVETGLTGESWNIRNQNSSLKIYEGTKLNSPAVHIRKDGKVGIGTTQPSETFEVDGNIKLSGSLVSDGDICIGNCG